MIFKERLKELRATRMVTQEELAKTLDIPNSTIRRLESSDISLPRYERLEKIANYFNVSVDYLLGRTDNPKNILTDNEQLFVNSLELTDKHVLEKINFLNVDGSPLTKEEALEFIAFVRAKRSINKE
ncbi:transcriptional regulator [Brevibacillus laterosporus]|uniref:Helix-turn-helix transcriptional regulator n=1 Tax=Brevibacillus laterosporus TaxID=1465 RepID=A0AAP3DLM3_BRELA|nr:helix-turn-helix transcriptional regulator [Brevibacillus laterosporus]MCR8983247.1 helix-turn-helix transcriptional regulator [Brevibacillus laterosporus]MCZ0810403.1 helix-turn-helix transcriptional regulator [Brevibacillus laterosporus]MCZ0853115.1 helix-turn-helix transcriptional regulator [Brevibacillus laterosporus]PPA82495.1 transcriptional regulator [Brevibacillus laterosporus]